MNENKEIQDTYNADFDAVFFDYNNKERKILESEKNLDALLSVWSFITLLMPLSGFYLGGQIAFCLSVLSIVMLITTGTLAPKILERKKANLSKNKNLIKLLYSESFHKMLFPYLNRLVENHPEHFTYEVEESGKKIIVDKTQTLKKLLITDYTPENLLKIKGELHRIDNLAIRIEKEHALANYEKQIGVAVSLEPVLTIKKDTVLENELVKML